MMPQYGIHFFRSISRNIQLLSAKILRITSYRDVKHSLYRYVTPRTWCRIYKIRGENRTDITIDHATVYRGKGSVQSVLEGFEDICELGMDELFNTARLHLAEGDYVANALPMEAFLISMLLEERKKVSTVKERVYAFEQKSDEL